MVYNLENITSSSTFLGFTQHVSTDILGGYLIGYIFLMTIFCIFFFAMKARGSLTAAAFGVSCWMTSLTALLLKPMGLIDDYTWWVAIMLTPIALFVLWIAKSKDG